MATTTLNISVSDSMKAKVEELVEVEGYGNTSEFFRDLVRRHLEEKIKRQLEESLIEGLTSGESLPFSREALEDIKKRGRERAMNRLS